MNTNNDDWMHLLVQTYSPSLDWLLARGILPVHLHTIGKQKSLATCYVSCVILASNYARFAEDALQPHSPVVRFELVTPDVSPRLFPRVAGLAKAMSSLASFTGKRELTLLQDSIRWHIRSITEPVNRPTGPPAPTGLVRADSDPLVCVIDDRPNVFSAAFADNHRAPLIRSVWHQGGEAETMALLGASGQWEEAYAPASDPKGPSGALLGCRNASSVEIGPQEEAAGEASHIAYKSLLVQWPTPATSHGSAVLDLIAGRTLWAAQPAGGPPWMSRPSSMRKRPADVHFVQLPVPTVVDTAGGSLAANVLDGIHDALEQASDGQSVIVNISFGTHGGGHDGTSMLEGAMRELLDLYNGGLAARGKTLHIVLPAGNSHLLRCHAMGTLQAAPTGSQPAQPHLLYWKVQPDSPSDSFMELWFPNDCEVEVKVQAPDRSESVIRLDDKPSYSTLHKNKYGSLVGALIAPPSPSQSTMGRMALFAVMGTGQPHAPSIIQDKKVVMASPKPAAQAMVAKLSSPLEPWLHNGLGSDRVSLAPHGTWQVSLSSAGSKSVDFHAWIQRSDTAPLRGRSSRGFGGRQSYFLDVPGSGVDPRFTLNGIAAMTHERLFVVGSMRRSDNCLSTYSSAGPNREEPNRCEGPDWVVRTDESRNQPGLLVRGFHGGAGYRVSGTSMAAAVLTRHLYEHLASGGTAASFQRLPHQYDGCHSARFDAGCTERVSVEAPKHGHPLHRGIWHRRVPTKDDGSW